MKKTTLYVASWLLASISIQAENTITKLWEYSDATSSKPSVIGTNDIRDFDVYNGTIYIQDKDNQKLHLFSKDGNFKQSMNSGPYHIISFDQGGNLVFCNATPSQMALKLYNFNTKSLDNLYTLTTGVQIDHPTLAGNLKAGTGYLYGLPEGGNMYSITTNNGTPSGYNICPLSTVASDVNYVIPVNADSVIICLRSNKIFYYDIKNNQEGAILVSGNQNTESIGGSYFEYKGERYLVQAYQSEGNHLGAFRVYNITDPNNVYTQYERTTNLGANDNTLSKAVHFETEVQPDGVYIYQLVPKNGIAAYKLAEDGDTKIESNNIQAERIYSQDGKLFVSGTATGDKVTVYNLQGKKLYETVANGDIVIDNMPINEFVIVQTTNQALKISIR